MDLIFKSKFKVIKILLKVEISKLCKFEAVSVSTN